MRRRAAGAALHRDRCRPVCWNRIEACTRWVRETPGDDAAALSTRVRLARNLSGVPFPSRITCRQAQRVMDQVRTALSGWTGSPPLVISADQMTETVRDLLVERRLMSPDFAGDALPRMLVIFPERRVSIMVNEEDHLRIQGFQPGVCLDRAWKDVLAVESFLDRQVAFAFSDRTGYLTTCPTNAGTGLRCSVLMHLPALVFTNEIRKILPCLDRIGLVIRGFYGEGTEPAGDIFQIATGGTIGKTETQILSELQCVVELLEARERSARARVAKDAPAIRRIRRVLARRLAREELSTMQALGLLSLLTFAESLGITEEPRRSRWPLMFDVMPGHLQARRKAPMSESERDRERGRLLSRETRGIHVRAIHQTGEGHPGRRTEGSRPVRKQQG